jgi:hypothetical protein
MSEIGGAAEWALRELATKYRRLIPEALVALKPAFAHTTRKEVDML